MKVKSEIYEGEVKRGVCGGWGDCSSGLYIDEDKIENFISEYEDKYIRLTIEVIQNPKSNKDSGL